MATLAALREEISVDGNLPCGRLPRCICGSNFLHHFVVFLRVWNAAVVIGLLEAVQVLKGVLHRFQTAFLTDSIQRRGIEVFAVPDLFDLFCELFFIPHPCLLDDVHIQIRQQEPKKIGEIPGNGMHIVTRQIHGADREDGFAQRTYCAVMDAVHSGATDDLCAFGCAEIGNIVLTWRFPTDVGCINFQFLKFGKCH